MHLVLLVFYISWEPSREEGIELARTVSIKSYEPLVKNNKIFRPIFVIQVRRDGFCLLEGFI